MTTTKKKSTISTLALSVMVYSAWPTNNPANGRTSSKRTKMLAREIFFSNCASSTKLSTDSGYLLCLARAATFWTAVCAEYRLNQGRQELLQELNEWRNASHTKTLPGQARRRRHASAWDCSGPGGARSTGWRKPLHGA